MMIDEWKEILRNTEQTVEAYQEVDKNYCAYINSLNKVEKERFLAAGGWSIGESIFYNAFCAGICSEARS